jgi:predicted nucleotide-binding protein (sugar kinase/HSP70/actin superfamily)
VSGYADVIHSTIDPLGRHGVPMDSPPVNFGDRELLRKACHRYLAGLGIPARVRRRAFERAVEAQRAYKQRVRDTSAEIIAAAEEEGRPLVMLLGRPYHIDRQINHKTPDILANLGIDVITEDAAPTGDLENVQMLTAWENPNRIYRAVQWAARRPHTHLVQFNSFGCGPDSYVVDEARGLADEYGRGLTVLRIDEIESTGSSKLRLRSMLEIQRTGWDEEMERVPRRSTALFEEADRNRTVLVPQFAEFCTTPIVRPMTDEGYRVALMDPSDRESVDVGLKYANNEICYPGIIVVGDAIKALQSGRHDRNKIAIGLWETGGQCRASCIFGATKKAMLRAGFEDVPLITVSTGGTRTNKQPGFQYSLPKFMANALTGIAYADALSAMYHSTAVREVRKGQAQETAEKYLGRLEDGRLPLKRSAALKQLTEAVDEFNQIETRAEPLPKVVVLGEIYVKYNRFSNFNVVPWLMSQGIEVLVPPLADFFATWFVSVKAQLENLTTRPSLLTRLSGILNRHFQSYLDDVGAVMQHYRYYMPQHSIHDLGKKAAQILSLTHQYGESWLIAGEISDYAEGGIPNVLCLQPFGCIANHVVAKGVEKRLRAVHPELNLLFLDSDHATSEVNYYNRLHFFIDSAREGLRSAELVPVHESVV